LGAKYLAEAPERMREIRGALAQAAAGDRQALTDLRMLLHRIAGSAGSYGFDEATTRARHAEAVAAGLLDSGSPLTPEVAGTLAALIDEVRAAFPAPR
jgi:chemotaxis protein histidine kinase CheA